MFTLDQRPGKGCCGVGSWKAARETAPRSKGKLDEEGLEIAVCRHGILQGALNMMRGEIFGYPLFLHKRLQAEFVCTDTTCKYWPYLERLAKANVAGMMELCESTKPFLSVMHAKAHSLKCEVMSLGNMMPSLTELNQLCLLHYYAPTEKL